MSYVKKSHAKRNLAALLILIIVIACVSVVYLALNAKQVEVGVEVGDTFTYQIKGFYEQISADAVASDGFSNYNETDNFKVVVTNVNGTIVSLDSVWRFTNGTEVKSSQTINLANGDKSDENGFWAIYPANLNEGDLLRPTGYDGNIVNNTDTFTYKGGERGRCYWFINNQFTSALDPTQSTLLYDYRNIFFDRETGLLTSFTMYQYYNNPQKSESIRWTLVNSTVWDV